MSSSFGGIESQSEITCPEPFYTELQRLTEEIELASRIGGSPHQRFQVFCVPSSMDTENDRGTEKNPSRNLSAVPILDRGVVDRNGEYDGDAAEWRVEGQHRGE